MSTTKPDSDSRWGKEFAALSDGWYWSRKTSLPRPRKDVLHVVRSQVAFGSMWLRPDKDPTFFENREWLGPLTSSDFEQLIQLRKLTQLLVEAAQFSLSTPGMIRGRDQLAKAARAAGEALTPTGEQS